MHGMLRRAAVSAVPALVGLVAAPASVLAAPHVGQAAANTVTGGREAHERLVQLPLPGTIQGRPVGATGTAKTTADTHPSNGTGAGFATTPAVPVIATFTPTFAAVPVYPLINGDSARLARFAWGPGSANGAPAYGIVAPGSADKLIGNHITSSGGSGNIIYRNVTGSGTGSVGPARSKTIYRNVVTP
jgi:hypothetical protein